MPRSNNPQDLINALEEKIDELSMTASTDITCSDVIDFVTPEFKKIYNIILDYGIATEDEIRLVCQIQGNNVESLNSIIFARTGCRDIDSYLDEFDFAE